MNSLISFPPLTTADARLLILGSMPGVASLRANQYYAHPQNLFWKFLGTALGFDPALPYEERVARLGRHGIAVWDVLASCVREGSLDADIDPSSAVPNDFADFFARHAQIRRVCFNGAVAAKIFRAEVQPRLPATLELEYLALPSTSPANASIPLADKACRWATALQFELPLVRGSPL